MRDKDKICGAGHKSCECLGQLLAGEAEQDLQDG